MNPTTTNDTTVTIHFVEPDQKRTSVQARPGQSLLEIARQHNIDLEGACEGSLACSTCQVWVDPAWYDRLDTATDDEEDMLDLAFNLKDTSRLGCQIIVSEALNGLTVEIPPQTRHMHRTLNTGA